MNPNLRKFAIAFVVLGAIVVVYLAYIRLGRSPRLELDTEALVPDVVRAPGPERLGGGVGTIGDVGIGKVEQTQFLHTDERGRVDRKFGFDELVHSEAEQWIITNPYMDLFLGPINCRVTADRGEVQLETALAQSTPTPSDATFTGNVVIRIIPADPNDPLAVFIYLDDVAFIADQSLFATTGAVKFVSRTGQLVGRGMELLYDESASRLHLFRIRELESLRLRSAEFGSLSGTGARDRASDRVDPNEPAPAVGPAAVAPPAEVAAPAADVYECIFHRNVVITTPEQKIAARDRLVIGNILWSGSQAEAADDKKAVARDDAAAAATPAGDPNGAGPAEPDDPPYPGPEALDTSPSAAIALEAIPESFFDIVVTCDGGFVVAPKGSRELLRAPDEWDIRPTVSVPAPDRPPSAPAVDPNRQTALAQRIDFDATTTDTTLSGPVTMTFAVDANDLTGRDTDDERVPVTITAQDAVRYLAAAGRILLEGNCAVTLQQTEPNYTHEYMLTAPMLALDLIEDPNARPGGSGVMLRQFTASGGPVAVHALRKAGADLVGWVELKASKLDFQAAQQMFTVSGPGKISLHNGEELDVGADPNEFSIGQPCFAFMRNFDSLTYSAAARLIVAEAENQQILLDYYPQVDGSYDERFVQADAGRLEVALAPSAAGQRVELASIAALEGISFVDNDNEFEGARLFYDHAQNVVTVTGDDVQPCLLNDALVDRIEMNPKTGAIKTQIQSPSILQINR